MVSGWGGRLYFVYLPSFDFIPYLPSFGQDLDEVKSREYKKRRWSIGNEDKYRENQLRTATKLDIPVIDILTEVFLPHPDPLPRVPETRAKTVKSPSPISSLRACSFVDT